MGHKGFFFLQKLIFWNLEWIVRQLVRSKIIIILLGEPMKIANTLFKVLSIDDLYQKNKFTLLVLLL